MFAADPSRVDELITTGVLRRVLAFTELKFSNSMIEASWRSLKHQWLFLHSLDSVTTVWRLVALTSRNTTGRFPIRRFADRRLTRCTSGRGDAVPPDLTARAAAARRARLGQSIGGLREVPVHRRGRMITDNRPRACGPVSLEGNAGDKQRARSPQ